jgi:molybdate transport system substrate-binding protein
MSRPSFSRALTLGLAGFLSVAASAEADELRVVSSGGFAAAYRALAPEFEHESGVTLVSQWGPSMGNTPQAVPARLARGEQIDVVIMVGYALGNLATQGKVVADSCVELARSGIGVAVATARPSPILAPSRR